MGFRFRKSVKIAPGIKVNLSKSGASLSLGGRGATVNLSGRGVRTTYSIPGTGISYVSQTSSGKSSASNRATYRELLRQQKEQEKQSLIQEAEEAYSLFYSKIESLSNILRNRERQPFRWQELTVSRGEYVPIIYAPPDFIEPELSFSEETLKQQIKNKYSRLYLTYFFLGLAFVLVFQSFWIALSVLFLAAVSYVIERKRLEDLCNKYLPGSIQEKTEQYNQIKQKAYNSYLEKLNLERAEHARAEEEVKQTCEEEEKNRQRLRDAVTLQDPEPLTELLEVELSNEDLPIPLVFDIEFVDVSTVTLLLELPELDVVPEEKLSLTKTGKLSTKKTAQKDRIKLYSDICTGLALRLIYETFRVIYSVSKIKLYGLTQTVSPSNGHTEDITSLYVEISRQDFEHLNLDAVEPTLSFKNLKGAFACSKNGELLPLKTL